MIFMLLPGEPSADELADYASSVGAVARTAIDRAIRRGVPIERLAAEVDLSALEHLVRHLVSETRVAWRYAHDVDEYLSVDRADRDAAIATAALGNGFDPRGFFVYLMYADDPLIPIYIGQSSNVLARLGAHMTNVERRYRVTRVDLIRCSTPQQMSTVEANLINRHRPELNVAGIPVTGAFSA